MKMCANCRADIPDRIQAWHKCQSCGKEFCGYCGDKLIDSSMRCMACRKGRIDVKSIM